MAKSDVGRFRDLVFDLLKKHSNLRDDTGLLYVACVAELRGIEYTMNVTLYDHFKYNIDITGKKLPSITSVIRLSTKLQKENPELRGAEWKERQKHSKDYKEDLGYGER